MNINGPKSPRFLAVSSGIAPVSLTDHGQADCEGGVNV
jgi:hypothetical protein